MRRLVVNNKKTNGNRKLSTILSISAITVIATTAITWIGVMDVNKK